MPRLGLVVCQVVCQVVCHWLRQWQLLETSRDAHWQSQWHRTY
jgi:hypothetical protein